MLPLQTWKGLLFGKLTTLVRHLKSELRALSTSLDQRDKLPPRNLNLFPNLAKDHTKIIFYVHNLPLYLKLVVQSLAAEEGNGETLLIVSHGGYFPEMDSIVQGIRFCQIKQIFAPYSPPNSFPGISPGDCADQDDLVVMKCNGTDDRYSNHNIVSLKHHWWWMLNTVWDVLDETKEFTSHILFIEEDHYICPNAYWNLHLLNRIETLNMPLLLCCKPGSIRCEL
ncbi:alpha-1,6-mannosyl-glycoprotein 2-beta-N-acetylglucosaminyltransferase-like [Zingiber officinale]|uniref:Alpha-1,6-mannosyl-glycoprotein 2-beta-N-acetylglucosaminyltransferase n=1 Tax=Zingiber officinale TaxID=94328 RepID=A0A8J5HZM5_ZINOF|nr:alpha-1,6-mannosyl-glycoprotein 2-beta-N-acetylglucosaminyltransferase-like [Zingiber officinale]KAG6533154.1 hypothetical protein ZIOFF_007020 [Zingiber officinale]